MLQQSHTWTTENHDKAVAMWSDGATVTEVATHFSISRSAVSGYISRNREVFQVRRKDALHGGTAVARKPATAWTPERIAEAAKLWADGWKEEEIGEHFGVSKAVIANMKCRYRSQFPKARDRTNSHPPKPRKPRIVIPDNLDDLFEKSETKQAADGRRFILSGRQPVAFASLILAQCRFPVGAPDDQPGPSMACCGAERAFGQYCAAHYAVAHRRPE